MLLLALSCCLVPGSVSLDIPIKVHETAPRSQHWLQRIADLPWRGAEGLAERVGQKAPEQPAVGRVDDNSFMPFRKLQAPRTGENELPRIKIDHSRQFQEILGFGGAFTATSATNWMGLQESDREKVIKLYFGSPAEGGHGYAMGRVPINSCDFSPEIYSLDDARDDVNLDNFDWDLSHDRKAMLPFIQAAVQRAEASNMRKFRMIASPWSPPAWMKRPHVIDSEGAAPAESMLGSAVPLGLRAEYSRTWAEYISRFVLAYKSQGVNMWAVTAQNEPEAASPWEANAFPAHDESVWIRQHLGPVLRRDHPELNILAFDHNKDHLVQWAKEMYEGDSGASKDYVDGLAMHWYTGSYFDQVREAAAIGGSRKWLIGSEACNCPGIAQGGDEQLLRAERLAHDLLGDLNAGAHSWLDWNLILDPFGGPSHEYRVQNKMKKASCDANIIADPARILKADTVMAQPSYYYIGHFSRFARPGAHVVSVDRSSLPNDKVHVIGFLSPDPDAAAGEQAVVLVVLNSGEQPVEFVLEDIVSGAEAHLYSVPPRSVTTFTYPATSSPLSLWERVFPVLSVILALLCFAACWGQHSVFRSFKRTSATCQDALPDPLCSETFIADGVVHPSKRSISLTGDQALEFGANGSRQGGYMAQVDRVRTVANANRARADSDEITSMQAEDDTTDASLTSEEVQGMLGITATPRNSLRDSL